MKHAAFTCLRKDEGPFVENLTGPTWHLWTGRTHLACLGSTADLEVVHQGYIEKKRKKKKKDYAVKRD